jgi:acetyltransferase
MVSAARSTGKPLILHSDHAERDLVALAPLRQAGVPIYSSLESAAKSMAALRTWDTIQRRWNAEGAWEPRSVAEADANSNLPQTGLRALTEAESRARLAEFGIEIPKHDLVINAADARSAFKSFGQPVAMKLMSEKLIHKSDAGGVLLGIETEEQAAAAFDRLEELSVRLGDSAFSVLMTPMIAAGVECIIGGRRDPQFGPVIVFGAGGILVELVRDVSIRLAPTTRARARAAIEESAIARLLKGYRASRPADIDRLAELIAQVSRFIAASADIIEVDLNPVIANEQGAFIADARLVSG